MLPPKSLVVITPPEDNAQFAEDEFVKTKGEDTSVNVTVSPDATTVATVPEKSPAIVPKEPAEVVQLGASETFKASAADITEFPSGFSIRTL